MSKAQAFFLPPLVWLWGKRAKGEQGELQVAERAAKEEGGPWGTLLVLMLLCMVVRAEGLMGLPIFGDEAIYLRWAQAIRESGWKDLWVSLVDPKPPLHFWMLAGMWNWSKDPLMAGRMISVVAGVLMVPALYWVVELMWRNLFVERGEERGNGRVVGLLVCVLAIFCPFLAFYQRMALADGLFALMVVAAVGAGLQLVMATKRDADFRFSIFDFRLLRGVIGWGVVLGIVMGLAMMTRQNVSYVLWGVPVAAWVIMAPWRKGFARLVMGLLIAGVIAGAMWSPYLLAQQERYAEVGVVKELKRRVLYQEHFTESKGLRQRLELAGRNLKILMVPVWEKNKGADDKHAQYVSGWLWVYMTPGMYLLGLAGLVWMGVKKQWRMLLFLGGWLGLLVGPVVVFGAVVFSRYTLGAAVPLLIAGGYLLCEVLGAVLAWGEGRWTRLALAWGMVGVVLVGVLGEGVRETGRQMTDWQHVTLLKQDRCQYITGWTGGQATMEAVRVLRTWGLEEPLIVLTANGWGTPSDEVWAYVRGRPNTQVYYVDWAGREPILQPGKSPGTYRVRDDKYLYTPAKDIAIPPGTAVVYVTADPIYTDKGPVPAAEWLEARNEFIGKAQWYANPGDEERVGILRLR